MFICPRQLVAVRTQRIRRAKELQPKGQRTTLIAICLGQNIRAASDCEGSVPGREAVQPSHGLVQGGFAASGFADRGTWLRRKQGPAGGPSGGTREAVG